MSEFVKIASWQNPADAQHAKAVLGWNGIDGHVDGEDLIANLGGMGSAIGGIHLRVRQSDAERAVQVLEEYSRHEPGTRPGPWFCGKCEEEVDEGFELCWSCGEPREKVEAEFPALADFAAEPVGNDTTDPANATLPGRASIDATNPFAPPVVVELVETAEEEKSETQAAAERRVVWASNLAVCGLVLPFVGTLASLFLLFEAMRLSWAYSHEYRRLILKTLIFNGVVMLAWLAVLILNSVH